MSLGRGRLVQGQRTMNTFLPLLKSSPGGVLACEEQWVVCSLIPTIKSFQRGTMGLLKANLTASITHALAPNLPVAAALIYVKPSTQKSTPSYIAEVFMLYIQLTSLPSHASPVPRPFFRHLANESLSDHPILDQDASSGKTPAVNGFS